MNMPPPLTHYHIMFRFIVVSVHHWVIWQSSRHALQCSAASCWLCPCAGQVSHLIYQSLFTKNSICFYICKSNIFVLWTVIIKQPIWRGHLPLWEIVMSIFHYFLIYYRLSNKPINRKNSQQVYCWLLYSVTFPVNPSCIGIQHTCM